MNPPKINSVVMRLRHYSQVMAFKKIGRKRRKLAERQARHPLGSQPMEPALRVAHYTQQNGTPRLTPRQLRRISKKDKAARKGLPDV